MVWTRIRFGAVVVDLGAPAAGLRPRVSPAEMGRGIAFAVAAERVGFADGGCGTRVMAASAAGASARWFDDEGHEVPDSMIVSDGG